MAELPAIHVHAAEFCKGASELRWLDIFIHDRPKQAIMVPKELVNDWADALNKLSGFDTNAPDAK